MLSFLFGRRKRRTVKRKGSRKPPARLIKMCRKYKIKCTKKVGKRRVYKKIRVLKKQLKRKVKNKKTRKVRRTRRKTRFGEKSADEVKNSGEKLYNYINPISLKSNTFTPAEKVKVLPLIRQFLWDGWTMDVEKAPDGVTAEVVGVNVNTINVIMELVIPLRILIRTGDQLIKDQIYQQLRRILFMEFGMVITYNKSGTSPPGLNFGKRRVYKSITVLKKQLKRKLKNKKTRKVHRTRRTLFGKSDSEKALYRNAIKSEIGREGDHYKKVSKDGKHLHGVYEVTRVYGSGDIFFFVKPLKDIKDKNGYVIDTKPIGDEIKVFVGNKGWVRVA